jgi:hypothetical protein
MVEITILVLEGVSVPISGHSDIISRTNREIPSQVPYRSIKIGTGVARKAQQDEKGKGVEPE